VAFGPDTNFGDHAGWHVTFSHVFMDDEQSAPPHERVPFVDGIENPSEEFPNIVRWLVGHGYAPRRHQAGCRADQPGAGALRKAWP
jgi:membrane dipeptidase